jgi:membrane protease YdiL (CAAX protease family)
VLAVAFGATVPGSLAALFGGLTAPATPPITDAVLLHSALFEVVILVLLGLFLWVRGWSASRLGLAPSWFETGLGLPLAVIYYLLYAAVATAAASASPRIQAALDATQLIGGPLSWPTIALVSVVNPVFEEVLLCGYLMSVVRERAGVVAAVNASVALRAFCHFYQGAIGLIGIVPLALLFGWWYARTSKLWPLIIAHALLDLAALALGS